MRKLGSVQRAVLLHLYKSRSGIWHPNCGWAWGSVTEKVLASLEKLRLVDKTAPRTFEITTAGRAKAKELRA